MKVHTAAVISIVAVAACLTSVSQAAASDTAPSSATMAVVGTDVVTTAHVAATPYVVHVARAYTYDLYATCWSSAGKPQAAHEQRIAAAVRVPGSAGSYQTRLPLDTRTSFTMTDPVAMLAHPQSGTRSISCPKRLKAGVSRAHVTSAELSVTSEAEGTQTVHRLQNLVAYFPAP